MISYRWSGIRIMKNVSGISMLSLLAMMAAAETNPAGDNVTLSPLLMYVADRSGADAIAPKVARLIEGKTAEQIHIDEFDRVLLEATGCFGSEALSTALEPLIPRVSPEDMPEIAQHMALLHEMWTMFDQITLALQEVDSYEDAEIAAGILENFKPFMFTWSQAVAKVPEPETAQAARKLRMVYLTETRPRIGKLLNAWGDLALRDAHYYGSAGLVEGLQDVCDVLENMDMAADPDVMPALATTTRELIPLLNQWLGIISLVYDKDTADAAAPHIVRIHLQMREVMQRATLSRIHEKDLFNVSPRFEVQAHICDRIMHYLTEELEPPCYGSEKLSDALKHED